MRIALVRLDKIGDLVCTLPVDQTVELKSHSTWWVISQGLAFIPSHAEPGRRFLQVNKQAPFDSFLILVRFFRNEKIQALVSFQAPWWVSLAAVIGGVRQRIGVRSQWHSFLFLTHGLRQKRSQSILHEADYNQQLMDYALSVLKLRQNKNTRPAEILKLRAPHMEDFWGRFRHKLKSYFVVHPGMAGSALNWPQSAYVSLIRGLCQTTTVVITGTPADEPWLSEIRQGLIGESRVHWLVGEASPSELLQVLGNAKAVFAPSTGVAHLAASLGVPVVCVYPSLKVQSATRWRPRGDSVKVLSAPHEAPGDMKKITVASVLGELKKWQ